MRKRVLPRSKDLPGIAMFLLLASLMIAGTPAAAQDYDDDSDEEDNWEIFVGAGVSYEPTFEGAKDHETTAQPNVFVTFGDRFAFATDEGLTAALYDSGSFGLTANISYDAGREEADDPHLAGLGDIEGGAALGFGVEYEAGPLVLYADLERSFGGSDGVEGEFGTEVSGQIGQVLLGANLSATWADDNYMQDYFGVTAAQSASSGLATYQAGAGFKSIDLEVSATYVLSENWVLQGEIEIGELLGDAADSPIVQDTTQTSAGIYLAYKF